MENPILVGEGEEQHGGAVQDPFAGAIDQLAVLRARVEEMTDRLRIVVRERPATSLLIAIGAGYLVGRILRA